MSTPRRPPSARRTTEIRSPSRPSLSETQASVPAHMLARDNPIRVVREHVGRSLGRRVTLQEFGATIGELEGRPPWPSASVSRWENGKQRPGPATLAAIAKLGGLKADDLESRLRSQADRSGIAHA